MNLKKMKRQDGSVLITGLIFMLVLIILVGALSLSLNSELKIVNNEHRLVQAQYYAESVINYASFYLEEDVSETASFWTGTGEVNPGKVKEIINKLKAPDLEIISLRRMKDNENYILSTNIRYKGVRDNLMVTFAPFHERLGIFDKAMAAGGNVNVNGKTKVDGPVTAGGDVNNQHNLEGASDIQENADIEKELALLEGFLEEAVKNSGTISISSLEYCEYATDNGDHIILDIDEKIVYITGNLTMDKSLYIMGSGFLIIEGSLNQNNGLLFANYNSDTGTYTDDYAILYFRTGNPNPKMGNFKGAMVGKSDVNIITEIAKGFEIIGAVYSGNNLNVNEGTNVKHDDGFVEVLKKMADKYDIPDEIVITTYKMVDWMEF